MQFIIIKNKSIVLLHCAGGMQTYVRKNGLFLALFFIIFAIGLLSCLNARTPNFAAGNAPTTIALLDFLARNLRGNIIA